MKIILRADSNTKIGMGHIMRTLSIADAFKSAGHNVFFLIADDTVSSLICERGYESFILHSDYKNLDDELSLWPALDGVDFIIVDSYYVTDSYLRFLREKLRSETDGRSKLVYLDDVYTFPYPVDILVNYNAYGESIDYKRLYAGGEVPSLILGPTYAPLRSMFRNIPKRVQEEQVKNILISTGGADELHLTLAIIIFLLGCHSAKQGCVYHFLLGAMNTDKEEIHSLASEDDSIVLHEDVTDMKCLISGMDIVISAAGSTLYEVCSCGVPLITYSLANNQILGAEAFERLRLAVNIGDLRDPDSIDPGTDISGGLEHSAVERIMIAKNNLAEDTSKRIEMGKRMQELIDGFGADRMVHKIIYSPPSK